MGVKADTQEEIEEQVEETLEEEKPTDELVHLQEKLVEAEDKYKRALADYQNLERHMASQKSAWARQSAKQIVLKLLPVLDTLLLVYKHTNDEGVNLVIKDFLKILDEEGVSRIETVGKSFDPHSMDCITTQEGKNDMVLEEVRSGFMLDGQVLRPAQVIVGKE